MIRKITRHLTVTFITFILALPSLAEAGNKQRIVLDFGDREYRTKPHTPTTVYLKKHLKNRYPHLRISDLHLNKVIIVAKSRKGRGTVQLRTGSRYSDTHRISSFQRAYNTSSHRTFSRVILNNPGSSSNGPWQLILRGRIMVRKVILVIAHDPQVYQRHDNHYSRDTHDNYNYQNQPSWQYRELRHTPVYSNTQSSLILQPRSWGTGLEQERSCSQVSANVPDGWDYPHTICTAYGNATYRRGYQPVKLYIRPDIKALETRFAHSAVSEIAVELSISAPAKNRSRSDAAATLGVVIGGKKYTKQIFLDYQRAQRGKSSRKTITIPGHWNKKQLHKAQIWVLPKIASGDFAVTGLQVRATRLQ